MRVYVLVAMLVPLAGCIEGDPALDVQGEPKEVALFDADRGSFWVVETDGGDWSQLEIRVDGSCVLSHEWLGGAATPSGPIEAGQSTTVTGDCTVEVWSDKLLLSATYGNGPVGDVEPEQEPEQAPPGDGRVTLARNDANDALVVVASEPDADWGAIAVDTIEDCTVGLNDEPAREGLVSDESRTVAVGDQLVPRGNGYCTIRVFQAGSVEAEEWVFYVGGALPDIDLRQAGVHVFVDATGPADWYYITYTLTGECHLSNDSEGGISTHDGGRFTLAHRDVHVGERFSFHGSGRCAVEIVHVDTPIASFEVDLDAIRFSQAWSSPYVFLDQIQADTSGLRAYVDGPCQIVLRDRHAAPTFVDSGEAWPWSEGGYRDQVTLTAEGDPTCTLEIKHDGVSLGQWRFTLDQEIPAIEFSKDAAARSLTVVTHDPSLQWRDIGAFLEDNTCYGELQVGADRVHFPSVRSISFQHEVAAGDRLVFEEGCLVWLLHPETETVLHEFTF